MYCFESFIEEISRQLTDSSTKVVVTLPKLWKTVDQAVRITKKHIPIIVINEVRLFNCK